MPRNGSGTYQLPPGINPVVTQTLITSAWANTTMSDLAAAITQSLSKDGQTTPTANLPMGGYRHTGVGDPLLPNQYATLSMTQSGANTRLTDVAGTNDITGNLPGNVNALTLGQLVQLIPTSDNTGPATLNINGIGPKPIITDAGSQIAEGNLITGRPYLLIYDGTSFVMLTGGFAAVSQAAISGWDRPSPDGPYPSISIFNPSTVSIPAGHGRIVHPSARDLAGVKEVTWTAQNVTLTGIASAWSTTLAINEDGNVVQFTGPLNAAWARENIIIGTATHINGSIDSVSTAPAIYGDGMYASYDLTTLFNNTFISGGNIYANGTNPYRVNMTSGLFFSLGLNSSEVNAPNFLPFPNNDTGLEFYPVAGNSAVSPLTMNVPVTQYDANGVGVVTALPGTTTATIHRMYYLNGEYLFSYGQNTYSDLSAALAAIPQDDSSYNPPSKLSNAAFLGRIIAQKDATNLNDATKVRFIAGQSTGSGGSAGGGVPEAPIDGITYGRKDATWIEVLGALRGPAGTYRLLNIYTDTSLRWALGGDNETESGANTGTDFIIRSYDDAGTPTGVALKIDRATRQTTLFADQWTEEATDPAVGVRATGNSANTRQAQFFINASGEAGIRTTSDTDVLKSQVRLLPAGGLALDTTIAGTPVVQILPTRFIADFNNATLANRYHFQTSNPNASTVVGTMPSGTGNTAYFSGANSSDPANTAYAAFGMANTQAIISMGKFGTGVTRPLSIQFDGVEKAYVSVGGTVGAKGTFINEANRSSAHWALVANSTDGSTSYGGIWVDSVGVGLYNALFNASVKCSDTGTVTLSGNVVASGAFYVYSNGAPGTQQIVTNYGYNNNIPRWKQVIESGGTWSLYGYDTAGGSPTMSMQCFTNPAGGQQRVIISGIVESTAANAGLQFNDRTSGRGWLLYGSTDQVLLYNGSTNIISGTNAGVWSAPNFIATSDGDLKDITGRPVARDLAPLLQFTSFTWKLDAPAGSDRSEKLGLIAQEVQAIAPEYVEVGLGDHLAIDKMGLLTECVIAQAARIKELEERLERLEALLCP